MSQKENISSVLSQEAKNNNNSSEAQKKAIEILEILKRKNKDWYTIEQEARKSLSALLRQPLDAEITTEMLETDLEAVDYIVNSPTTPKDKEQQIEQDVSEKVDKLVEEYRSKGWTDAYIFAKVLSLWYIPKNHDSKYTWFLWTNWNLITKPIKWVWANKAYVIQWWLLTNWTINEPFIKAQTWVRNWLLKSAISEEAELKMVLKSVTWGDITWDRTKLNQRLQALQDYKSAINSWDINGMKTAWANYANISEETWTIKSLFKKYWVEETIKKQNEKAIDDKQKKAWETAKKDVDTKKWKAIYELDKVIKSEVNTLDSLKDTTMLQSDLDLLKEERALIETDKQLYTDEKRKLEWEYNRINDELRAENWKRWWWSTSEVTRLQGELSRLRLDISNQDNEIKKCNTDIRNKEAEIRKKEIEIRDLPKTNKNRIDTATEKKDFLEKLRTAVASWDHNTAKSLIDNYNYKHWAWKFSTDFATWIGNFETFITQDHAKHIETETKNWSTPKNTSDQQKYKQERRDIRNKTTSNAIDKEINSITAEVQKTEIEINKIKQKAEKQLQELDKVAKQNPSKVPELRKEFEKTVEWYNAQIAELEKRWVESLKKLKPDELKLLSTKSKWTEKMINANWWIDKIMSWKIWKWVWFLWIISLGHWIYSWVKETWFSSETKNNIGDMFFWMIPIVWGAYDLWRAYEWTDLNWKAMNSDERWTRFWFWVVWLVPLAWTVVKWSSTVVKTTETATKLAQKWELITEVWHLTWKVAWIWALWRWGISTIDHFFDKK